MKNSSLTVDAARKNVDEVFSKFERWANVKYEGEEITLLEHSLQIALLAEESGSPVEVILGALFHDVGHVLEVEQKSMSSENWNYEFGKHNETGHQYLTKLQFPEVLSSAALHHVNAKRYLVYSDQQYYAGLSETSKRTLVEQGGPMTKEEAQRFENQDNFEMIISVRKWDDEAKIIDKTIPPLQRYKEMCLNFLVS